ncbi:hypothetical protein CTI14_37705, partial [Methylobacterium radiotolerans]
MAVAKIPPPSVTLSLETQIRALELVVLSDPDAARVRLLQLRHAAQQEGDPASEAYALCLLGGCAFFQGNYPDTTLYAKFALNVSDRHEHLNLKARALNALGLALTRTGQYDEGMQYFLDSLTLADSLNDDASKARAITTWRARTWTSAITTGPWNSPRKAPRWPAGPASCR